MSSSSSSTATEQDEQEIVSDNSGSSAAATQSQETHTDSVSSTPLPMLPGQMLTISDHEDNFVPHMDELVQDFLSRFNLPNPYHGLFTWSSPNNENNHEDNRDYNVIILINQPADLI